MRRFLLLAPVCTLLACASDSPGSAANASMPSTSATTAIPVRREPEVPSTVGTTAVPTTLPATSTTIRIAPLTPRDPDRISESERHAIEALGDSGAGLPEHGDGHSHASVSREHPLFTGDAAVLAHEWLRAQASIGRVDTVEEAAALGYVRAAAPGSGVGTHWVLWSQIAKPFDPTRPAMLLFDERDGSPELVGYSYWVQSETAPDGFAGPFDEWHQHNGYCVVNGWVDRENVPSADECAGTYLAGGDLWMLHAWVVPGWANPNGRFAVFHPSLCPPRTAPDMLRCPD